MMTKTIVNRPVISITNVIWSFDPVTNQLLVLLLQRDGHASWGLPTTFLRADESADMAARRLVREKLGLDLPRVYTEQLATFTQVERTAGERELALTYMVYLPTKPKLIPGNGAQAVDWFAITPAGDRDDFAAGALRLPGLPDAVAAPAFYVAPDDVMGGPRLTADHNLIMRTALKRVRNRLDYAPTILLVLGVPFTLKRAREVYAILQRKPVEAIDHSNFRKTHRHLFETVGSIHGTTSGRPAKGYRLKMSI